MFICQITSNSVEDELEGDKNKNRDFNWRVTARVQGGGQGVKIKQWRAEWKKKK